MVEKVWARPYWRVDAKWVFGILCVVALEIANLLFIAATLTSEKVAIPIATYVVASQFSRQGLDDPKDIEEAKSKFLKTNQQEFRPLPQQEVVITRQELETLSSRVLRLRIFEQVVAPIYQAKRTDESLKKLGLLAFANYETHQLLQKIFFASLVPVVLFGIGMVAFSYRYGRLMSPGVVLVFVSGLLTAIVAILPRIDKIPKELVGDVAGSLLPLFSGELLVGIGFIGIAIFLQLFKS